MATDHGAAPRASRIALLRLLQLASPALPIGAYAYSRGFESAVSQGWVHDEASAQAWISGVLEHSLASMDGPVLLRLYGAFQSQDETAARDWNAFLCAARETRELALEDRQLGLSLARLLVEQGIPEAETWRNSGAHVTLFALACARWQVPPLDALSAYLFGFAENQVSCAMKLVPLGQLAGQRVLTSLMAQIDALVHRVPSIDDADIGSYTPRLSMASALHETQYARLFRS